MGPLLPSCFSCSDDEEWPELPVPRGGSFVPRDPPNAPVGTGVGVRAGRVTWVHDPRASSWDGQGGRAWKHSDQVVVDRMLADAVRSLGGEDDPGAAWHALFADLNERRGRGPLGYQPGETIAIKVNANADGSIRGDTTPMSAHALLAQLVDAAGIPPASITVYDASKRISNAWLDVCTEHDERFEGVSFAVHRGPSIGRTRGRVIVAFDPSITLGFSDPRVPSPANGHPPTHFPTCVTGADYHIDLAAMKQHPLTGVSLCAKNLFGSMYHEGGWNEGWSPEHLHEFVDVSIEEPGAPADGTYSAFVDLMGHPEIRDKMLLYLVDGLYAGKGDQDAVPQRWNIEPFGGGWTCSLFASQDWVALESVVIDVMRAEAAVEPLPALQGTVDNYLHEAALAEASPSGTVYDPDGDGIPLGSLGIHEHWNDPENRQYSRNLGREHGIELVTVRPASR